MTAVRDLVLALPEDELRELVPRVERLAEDAREVHVLMNNCHRDYSVRNAREIGEMLGVLAGSLIGARVLPSAGAGKLRLVFVLVILALGVQMIYRGLTGRL